MYALQWYTLWVLLSSWLVYCLWSKKDFFTASFIHLFNLSYSPDLIKSKLLNPVQHLSWYVFVGLHLLSGDCSNLGRVRNSRTSIFIPRPKYVHCIFSRITYIALWLLSRVCSAAPPTRSASLQTRCRWERDCAETLALGTCERSPTTSL